MRTDLPHLIGFRMAVVALQIDSLGDAFPSEYVMASSYPLGESQIPKQTTQIVEADIGIRATPRRSAPSAAARPSRAGKKGMLIYIDPALSRRLKYLALDEDKTLQQLGVEALEMLLASRSSR